MKIAILRDDYPQGNVSLDELDNKIQADFAQQSLSPHHEVIQIPFGNDIAKVMADIRAYRPDVVFNLVESVCGRGALSIFAVQLLEVMAIPFTGNHIYAQVISADKSIAKNLLLAKGIPTPKSCFQEGAEYIMKIKSEHASMSLDDTCIRTFSSQKQMKKVLDEKSKKTGMEWIAERYVEGREFNCAFLGKKILPPAEIRFDSDFIGHKILTYEAKWDEEALSYQQSLRNFDVEEDIAQRLKKITDTCRKELNLRGYARVDFRMDAYGNIFVIDINTNPCIAPDSGFVAMAERVGITHEQMFELIVKDACNS